MTAIANVELSNTFDTWRIRSNRGFTRLNGFATSASVLFANTMNANVAFRSAGPSHFVGNVVFSSSLDANGSPLLLDASANTRLQGTGTKRLKFQVGGAEPFTIYGSNVGINQATNPRVDDMHGTGLNATLSIFQPNAKQTNTMILTSNAYNALLGPEIALFRDNNVRAAMDNIGVVTFRGRTNANVISNYAKIYATIDDHSNNLEDGSVTTQVMRNGILSDTFKVDADGIKLQRGQLRLGANVDIHLAHGNTITLQANTETGHTNFYVSSNGVGVDTQSFPGGKFQIGSGSLGLDNTYSVNWGNGSTAVYGTSNVIDLKTNSTVMMSIRTQSIIASANVIPGSDSTFCLGATGNEWNRVYADNYYGTLATAAQPNITSVGTLTALTVSGQMNFSSSVVFSQNSTTTSGTVVIDFDAYQNHFYTLNGPITLGNPTTENIGQAGVLAFKQDATGSRTLSLGTDWETVQGGGYTLTTTAGATDIIPYYVVGTNRILLGQIQKALA